MEVWGGADLSPAELVNTEAGCVEIVRILACGIGLLAAAPNIFPVILLFGLMGYAGIPLNVGTAMTAAIAIGIAVDDTLHFMLRYNQELRTSKSQTLAMQNIETLKQYEFDRIVTPCPHCMYTIGTEYKDFGGDFETVHHSRFINELIDSGRLTLNGGGGNGSCDLLLRRECLRRLGCSKRQRPGQRHKGEIGFLRQIAP